MRLLYLVLVALAACATDDVTATCQDTRAIVADGQPLLDVAPAEVRLAASVIGAGAVICGSAEYARARNVVIGWVESHKPR